MVLQNIPFGIWFSMSNGSLLLALVVAFGLGFAAGVVTLSWFNGRSKR